MRYGFYLSIASLLMISAPSAYAIEVLLRGPGGQPLIQDLSETALPDLTQTDRLEGKYFKVVLGKSDSGISIHPVPGESPEMTQTRLRAATVYYHLNRAHDYFVNVLHSQRARDLGQVTVRLELTNKFSELGHFANDNLDPQYNNALSIPAGNPMEGVPVEPWGAEIWFRPVKLIPTHMLFEGKVPNPLAGEFKALRKSLNTMAVFAAIQAVATYLVAPQTQAAGLVESLARTGGTFIVMEGALELMDWLTPKLLPKNFYLDTGMIPEVIYHEYAHQALSDHLALTHSTPVNEGMADYFAAVISGGPNIADRIKAYSTARPKKGARKQVYSPSFETRGAANADFVLGLLWGLRQEFPGITDSLIHEARRYLTTSESTIYDGLLRALLKSCNKVCQDPATDRMRMYRYFQKKGF